MKSSDRVLVTAAVAVMGAFALIVWLGTSSHPEVAEQKNAPRVAQSTKRAHLAGRADDNILSSEMSNRERAHSPESERGDHAQGQAVTIKLLRWPDSLPIRNTWVHVSAIEGFFVGEGNTDQDGLFPLGGEVFDVDRVEVSCPQYRSEIVPIRQGILEVLLHPFFGIVGRVIDDGGKGVPNRLVGGWCAEVPGPVFESWPRKVEDNEDMSLGQRVPHRQQLSNRVWRLAATGPTDGEGYYFVEAPGSQLIGEVVLHAGESSSMARALTNSLLPGSHFLDIELGPERLLSGIVIDGEGNPLPGASVLCQLVEGYSADMSRTRSDYSGMFELFLPHAEICVRAEKPGYRMNPGTIMKLGEQVANDNPASLPPNWNQPLGWLQPMKQVWGNQRTFQEVGDGFLTIEMEELPKGELLVFDASRGRSNYSRPVSGATVTVTYKGRSAPQTATTSPEGVVQFPIADASDQPMEVQVLAEGYQPAVGKAWHPGIPPLRTHIPLFPVIPRPTPVARDDDGLTIKGTVSIPNSSSSDVEIRAFAVQMAGERVKDYHTLGGGPARADRTFEFRLRDPLEFDELILLAWTGSGRNASSASSGPLPLSDFSGDLTLGLERSDLSTLDMSGLSLELDYRVRVRISLFEGLPPAWQEELNVPSGAPDPYRLEFYAPLSSNLSVVITANLGGREWPVAFRGPNSIRIGSHPLRIRLAEFPSVEGTVQAPSEERNLMVALCHPLSALNAYTTVESDGSFAIAPRPPGTYVLFIYRRSSPSSKPVSLFDETEVLSKKTIELRESIRDLELSIQE